MTEARAYLIAATLLPDGRVLVAGGSGSGDPSASADLYDPANGTWTATGSMIEARASHTATLLPTGKVLVAGGYGGPLASAELFDPSTGTWTATGSMIEARYHHTATRLSDGRVLVAGGSRGSGDSSDSGEHCCLASAELYDPGSGTWTATGSMNEGRHGGHTATLLADGTVLVVGNDNSNDVLASAELYDPSTGAWTVTAPMMEARAGHTATLLPDGTVLVAGGGVIGVLASAELYDPSTGTWAATGNMNEGRTDHAATLLPDGTVLAAGGVSGSSVIGLLASAELFDPGSGSWTATGSMTEARANPMATLLPDGTVLVAGGFHQKGCTQSTPCTGVIGPLASAELYDPRSGT